MKIYSMTATFGKLEHETLRLQPGLNVICAPNEWGKSTWCAFLATMLYGLDTREKTTKNNLAVKERYAPWSGSPMSGRIDLNWNGRDITIERWSKGRTPLGEFRAYETASGLDIPELTGTNCGQTLLGVEKSVFLRAGFLRLSDLPVTEDESLRRRLNALVTTGDESGAGDLLAQKLKDLKNKCRSNRANGLIPQVEADKAALEGKLAELSAAKAQQQTLLQRQQQLEAETAALENHRAALQYAAAQDNLHRVATAQEAADAAARQAEALAARCAQLPEAALARHQLEKLLKLQQQQQALQLDAQLLPQPPQAPNVPPAFYGLPAHKAAEQVQADTQAYQTCTAAAKKGFPFWIPALPAALAGAALLMLGKTVAGLAALAVGAVLLILHFSRMGRENAALSARNAKAEALRARYGSSDPQAWLAEARRYALQQAEYDEQMEHYQRSRQNLTSRTEALKDAIADVTGGQSLTGAMEHWKSVLQLQESLADALREQKRTADHAATLRDLAKPMQKPEQPDEMTCSEAETAQLLSDAAFELRQLQVRLGQCQGRMDALGAEAELRAGLEAVCNRLTRLNETYQALELALHTLEDATAQLQRRFAPRIAQQAQALFGRLTGGRYDRLMLQQDLSVNAGAEGETVLRSAQWRSEGTVDQLYLALRLAVARQLTPNAPFILDDALVRFDDTRHAAAMEILRQEAEEKQIILFSCQSRENP